MARAGFLCDHWFNAGNEQFTLALQWDQPIKNKSDEDNLPFVISCYRQGLELYNKGFQALATNKDTDWVKPIKDHLQKHEDRLKQLEQTLAKITEEARKQEEALLLLGQGLPLSEKTKKEGQKEQEWNDHLFEVRCKQLEMFQPKQKGDSKGGIPSAVLNRIGPPK